MERKPQERSQVPGRQGDYHHLANGGIVAGTQLRKILTIDLFSVIVWFHAKIGTWASDNTKNTMRRLAGLALKRPHLASSVRPRLAA
jgi:hypothetical protein